MSEHVRALFDYAPEHEDELPLREGEVIVVVEKDELHRDGWWTGRNSNGRIGIFPQNYTESAPSPTNPNGPQRRPFTDLYQAIDQQIANVQARRSPERKSSSASFSSEGTEYSEDLEDEGRFERLRTRLAERARAELAEARARHDEFGLNLPLPPIDVDLKITATSSEASEELESAQRRRLFDSAEGDTLTDMLSILLQGSSVDSPLSPSDACSGVDTAKQASFAHRLPADTPHSISYGPYSSPISTLGLTPKPSKLDLSAASNEKLLHLTEPRNVSPPISTAQSPPPRAPRRALSSASPIANATENLISASSKAISPRPAPPIREESTISDISLLRAPSTSSKPSHLLDQDPRTWSVTDVVDWLRSRNFEEEVCAAFLQQEVSGEVLLKLDIDVLKTELGIPTLGKRLRILGAIADLSRSSPQNGSSERVAPSIMFNAPTPISASEASLPFPPKLPPTPEARDPNNSTPPRAEDTVTRALELTPLPPPPSLRTFSSQPQLRPPPPPLPILSSTPPPRLPSPGSTQLPGPRAPPLPQSTFVPPGPPPPLPCSHNKGRSPLGSGSTAPAFTRPDFQVPPPPPLPTTKTMPPLPKSLMPAASTPRPYVRNGAIVFPAPTLFPPPSGNASPSHGYISHGRHSSSPSVLPALSAASRPTAVSASATPPYLLAGPYRPRVGSAKGQASMAMIPDALIPGRARSASPRTPIVPLPVKPN